MSDLGQFLIAGASLGSVYAILCLGFVVIYRASGVLNFAHGGLVVLGAYLTYQFGSVWGLPFALAVLLAMVVVAGLGLALERFVLRRMVGQPVFAIILITLGLLYVLEQFCTTLWGYDLRILGDPWGVRTVAVGGTAVKVADLWTIGAAGAALLAFFVVFRYSVLGMAMRAASSDAEAALAHGVSPQMIQGVAWAVAGALAVMAGVLIGAGSRGVDLTMTAVAMRAFPAMILGGLDSPGGAVAGGLLVGLTEVLAAAYITPNVPGLGNNVHVVVPYVLMILVLIVRPYGLFGTVEVRRV